MKRKKRNYKTIASLAKKTNQLTAQEVINQQAYIDNVGWIEVGLPRSERTKMAAEISELLGGMHVTRRRVFFNLLFSTPKHWGLNRIFFNNRTQSWEYCAGQDYSSEISQIRNALK